MSRAGLRKAFPKLRIEVVTGALTPEERRAAWSTWRWRDEPSQRLLVATDCLSEGINLQSLFDTVIHYDLSWNPTRHQQREGRVDRFGQPAKLVRSVLLFSPDSAIDGAVLEVILRKAEEIRKATGVTVPLPGRARRRHRRADDAVLLRRGGSRQLSPRSSPRRRRQGDGDALARRRGEREAVARALRPERDQAGGSHPGMGAVASCSAAPDEVRRFVERAMAASTRRWKPAKTVLLRPSSRACRRPARAAGRARSERHGAPRLRRAAAIGTALLDPHPSAARHARRDAARRRARSGAASPALARPGRRLADRGRPAGDHALLLLRLRFKLTVHARRERLLLAEEAGARRDRRRGTIVATGEAARDTARTRRPAPISRRRARPVHRQGDRAICPACSTARSPPSPGRARRRSWPGSRPRARCRPGPPPRHRRAGAAARRDRSLRPGAERGLSHGAQARHRHVRLARRSRSKAP